MRVLVAEDEPLSRHRLQAFLKKWGYSVRTAVDGAEALQVLSEADGPKLVVLDRMMPQVDGLEVCRRVRKGATEPYVYLILLTAKGEQQEVIEGFDAGADDYITKPFEVRELEARVHTGARIVELQEQLIAAREQLRVEAMHDPLTGLLNRAAFFEALNRELARARRRKAPLAVIMGDLDHFKAINDRYGHPAGDMVLRETARRLRASLRVVDSIGRYGGEEFIVAAPDCSRVDAGTLAERFRSSICTPPIEIPDGRIFVTMSFGVAEASVSSDAVQVLKAADQALYQAKNSGRNKVTAAER